MGIIIIIILTIAIKYIYLLYQFYLLNHSYLFIKIIQALIMILIIFNQFTILLAQNLNQISIHITDRNFMKINLSYNCFIIINIDYIETNLGIYLIENFIKENPVKKVVIKNFNKYFLINVSIKMLVIKMYHLIINNNFLIKNSSKDIEIKNFNNNFIALIENFSKDIAIINFNSHFMTLIKILINHYLHIIQIFKLYNFIVIITYYHNWTNCKHY